MIEKIVYLLVLISVLAVSIVHSDETDYNNINSDGSYSFGLTNSDRGGHYHSETGTSNHVVRGRYGSRNPANNRVEETVYTSGPRGFRARGPSIHRKMDLSQIPRGPQGSIDDPLADPYDVPTYGFGFRTSTYQRREDADPNGRVSGLYSYIDDIGERHSVRYAAGAGTGYQVSNAVPDTPSSVRYSAPLYKTNRNARGKVAYERGPGGQYKFISSGPDQRRSESTGADGITRGSYSYLDDKGVQRTVQYIAGAGIGYKIVQSTTGPGTHLAPRPAIPEFGLPSKSNDITDEDGSGFNTAASSSFFPQRNGGSVGGSSGNSGSGSSNSPSNNGGVSGSSNKYGRPTGTGNKNAGFGGNSVSGTHHKPSSSSGFGNSGFDSDGTDFGSSGFDSTGGDDFGSSSSGSDGSDDHPTGFSSNDNDFVSRDKDPLHSGGGGGSGSGSGHGSSHGSGSSSGSGNGGVLSISGSRPSSGQGVNSFVKVDLRPTSPNRGNNRYNGGGGGGGGSGAGNTGSGNRNRQQQNRPPYITSNSDSLNQDRNTDWSNGRHDSTIVKNVGDWYVGLPPGAAVRAHVQNIDLLPLGGRPPTPGDALRRDEQREYNNYDD